MKTIRALLTGLAIVSTGVGGQAQNLEDATAIQSPDSITDDSCVATFIVKREPEELVKLYKHIFTMYPNSRDAFEVAVKTLKDAGADSKRIFEICDFCTDKAYEHAVKNGYKHEDIENFKYFATRWEEEGFPPLDPQMLLYLLYANAKDSNLNDMADSLCIELCKSIDSDKNAFELRYLLNYCVYRARTPDVVINTLEPYIDFMLADPKMRKVLSILDASYRYIGRIKDGDRLTKRVRATFKDKKAFEKWLEQSEDSLMDWRIALMKE